MGGMLLQPKDSTPFLINSRQLAYLVQHKYLEYPNITAEEIWDKSKAHTLSKILTLIQASWLICQLIGRAITHLATSTLELSAGAIVFCTFGTFICWLHKPSDVKKGIVLNTTATTAQILTEAGHAAIVPYRHTPLDFVAKESFTCGYDVMGFFNLSCDNRERPLRRFPDDRFPNISPFEKFALFCATTAYASLHLIGWRFTFPTRIESLLWRTSSLVVTGTTVLFWIVETIAARQRFGRWDKYLIWLRLKKRQRLPLPVTNEETREIHQTTLTSAGEEAAQVTTISKEDSIQPGVRQVTISYLNAFEEEQRKAKPMLAWEVGMIFPVVILYAISRGYMIIEVFLGLRDLPLEVYQSFTIAQIVPHW